MADRPRPRGADRRRARSALRHDRARVVYLGGFTWTRLAMALRAEELRSGALGRADALSAVDRAPWCAEIF